MGKTGFLLRIFVFILAMLAACEFYLAWKGYGPIKASETAGRGQGVWPPLAETASKCGWGLESGRRMSSEQSSAWETVLPSGRRASSPEGERRKAGLRVLLLGGSYVFGSGLGDSQTMAWLLSRRYPDIDFENYGNPGWGTYQCLMLEERLLELKKYDLVVYCAINDHRCRNLEYRFVGSLKPGRRFAMYPRVVPSERGELLFFPSGSDDWPLQNVLRTVDFLHRAYIGFNCRRLQAGYDRGISGGFDRFMPAREKAFWMLAERMHQKAAGYGIPFVLALLEGEWEQWRYCAPPASPEYPVWKLSWPSITEPPYRIEGNTANHPNALSNELWFCGFVRNFEQEYGEGGRRLKENNLESHAGNDRLQK